ncbi:MAG: LysR family transcriptional regulator [Pseudomonadota bacterium]
MPDLRDMELLASLARNKHFARAAAECGISQPAFSARIRNLELDLGAPIVLRSNRFVGFTAEGEIALKWANQMIADARGLKQEINHARGALTGWLTIGAVPTALSFVATIAADLRSAHPALVLRVLSYSSTEIAQGLENFSLDAGVTYLESTLPAGSQVQPAYVERYELLAPNTMAPRDQTAISWADAAPIPLCLLPRNMMNRRFMDEAFEAANAVPNMVMETNAFTAALVQVTSGTAATIAPEMLIEHTTLPDSVARLKLTDPLIEKPISFVTPEREPRMPAVDAMIAALHDASR